MKPSPESKRDSSPWTLYIAPKEMPGEEPTWLPAFSPHHRQPAFHEATEGIKWELGRVSPLLLVGS